MLKLLKEDFNHFSTVLSTLLSILFWSDNMSRAHRDLLFGNVKWGKKDKDQIFKEELTSVSPEATGEKDR